MIEATNINELIENWHDNIKANSGFSESDAEELKNYLQDTMEELKQAGLDEEEAFIIASERIINKFKTEDEHRQENTEIIQTRRTAVILAGVLIYFLSFHLVGSLTKSLFVILLENDVPFPRAIFWQIRFLITWYFIYVFFFVSILLSERKVMVFLEKVKMLPKHTFLILVITLTIGIYNSWIMMTAKVYINEFPVLRDRFLQTYIYFEYSFPILFCLGFILIYYKYHKRAKV